MNTKATEAAARDIALLCGVAFTWELVNEIMAIISKHFQLGAPVSELPIQERSDFQVGWNAALEAAMSLLHDLYYPAKAKEQA